MQINFIISRPYNELFGDFDRSLIEKEKQLLLELWSEEGNKFVSFIEKQTTRKFKKNIYDCYLVQKLPKKGISTPLSIKVFGKTKGEFIILIHELLHILFVENKDFFMPMFKDLILKHNVIMKTAVHVIIYDILHKAISHIYDEKLFFKIREKEQYYADSFNLLDELGELKYF